MIPVEDDRFSPLCSVVLCFHIKPVLIEASGCVVSGRGITTRLP